MQENLQSLFWKTVLSFFTVNAVSNVKLQFYMKQ